MKNIKIYFGVIYIEIFSSVIIYAGEEMKANMSKAVLISISYVKSEFQCSKRIFTGKRLFFSRIVSWAENI